MIIIYALLSMVLGAVISSVVWVKEYNKLNNDWADYCFWLIDSWSDFAKDLIRSQTAQGEGESE